MKGKQPATILLSSFLQRASMGSEHKRRVMNGKQMELVFHRMVQQIIETNQGLDNVALIGIAEGGVPVTHRIRNLLIDVQKADLPLGMIDITLHRDDLSSYDQPLLKSTQIDFDIDGMNIVLIDDVLFTGRTVRAAIAALLDYGRPGNIQLAVLIDRGHRELPIQADFVGRKLDTETDEQVIVIVSEKPDAKKDEVVVISPIENEEN